MEIEFRCSGCGSKMKVPEKYAGRTGRCPKCSRAVAIPERAVNGEEERETIKSNIISPESIIGFGIAKEKSLRSNSQESALEYTISEQSWPNLPSAAEVWKKMKDQLDAGAISEAEYQRKLNGPLESQSPSAPPMHRLPVKRYVHRNDAGFWKRFFAFIIDAVITTIVSIIVYLMLRLFITWLWSRYNLSQYSFMENMDIALLIVAWLFILCYFPVMESSVTEATFGKMAMGIKVTDYSGHPISLKRAFIRYFFKSIQFIFLGIPFIAVGVTQYKQGFHDMLTGCLVVNAERY